MNKQIDKGIIAIVITIIILILACLGYILFEKNNEIKNKNNNTTTTNATLTTTTTSKVIGKIDESKEYIYIADYEHNIEKETYSINNVTYNINDYKVPYINLNSNYAEESNKEIKKIYDEVITTFKNGIEDNTSYVDLLEYKYYIIDNILSLVITTRYGGTEELYNNYFLFVIDLKTGEKINLDDLIKYKNINKEEFINKTQNKIIEEYNKSYENLTENDELYKKYYEMLKNETINNFNNGENPKYFIDNNKFMYVIARISIPRGRGYKDEIIRIEG